MIKRGMITWDEKKEKKKVSDEEHQVNFKKHLIGNFEILVWGCWQTFWFSRVLDE